MPEEGRCQLKTGQVGRSRTEGGITVHNFLVLAWGEQGKQGEMELVSWHLSSQYCLISFRHLKFSS